MSLNQKPILRWYWVVLALSRRRSYTGTHRATHGMITVEYAVGLLTAVAFAAGLYKVVSSPRIAAALSKTIEKALS